MRPVIVLSRRFAEPVMQGLSRDYTVLAPSGAAALKGTALATALANADAFCPTVFDPVTGTLIRSLPARIRLLASWGVGLNHLDLKAAKACGLAVTNTPDVLTDDTADLAIGLMIAAARRFRLHEARLLSGGWSGSTPNDPLGTKLTGKTLGIIGMGRIGLATAIRARAFNMPVIYWSRAPKAESEALGFRHCPSVIELCARADVISLHTALTADTRHLIGAAELEVMKPRAIIVNTGRGPLMDEEALVRALNEGRIAAAGLDVYENEPRLADGLAACENAFLLPHIGSATEETREAMGWRVKENLDAFFGGKDLPDRVA